MKIKELTSFCYDDYAKEMGFSRLRNEYHKLIGMDVLLSFSLGCWGNNRVVRPLMGIAPLCGELRFEWGKEYYGMHDPSSAYYRHTGIDCNLEYRARDSMEKTERIRAYLRDVFEQAQRPFFEMIKDIKTAYNAYKGFTKYYYEGALNAPDYDPTINHLAFLFQLEKYEEAKENLERFFAFRGQPEPETTIEGLLYRYLCEKNYAAIQSYFENRKVKNIENLKKEGIFLLCQGDG